MKFVYYSAEWCTPCKRVRPWVDAVAKKFGVEVETVNTDQRPVDGLLSVPTLDIIVGGELLKRIVRWSNASALAWEVEEAVG